jgi:hypothetical protein
VLENVLHAIPPALHAQAPAFAQHAPPETHFHPINALPHALMALSARMVFARHASKDVTSAQANSHAQPAAITTCSTERLVLPPVLMELIRIAPHANHAQRLAHNAQMPKHARNVHQETHFKLEFAKQLANQVTTTVRESAASATLLVPTAHQIQLAAHATKDTFSIRITLALKDAPMVSTLTQANAQPAHQDAPHALQPVLAQPVPQHSS